jgi:hypothetical protein
MSLESSLAISRVKSLHLPRTSDNAFVVTHRAYLSSSWELHELELQPKRFLPLLTEAAFSRLSPTGQSSPDPAPPQKLGKLEQVRFTSKESAGEVQR